MNARLICRCILPSLSGDCWTLGILCRDDLEAIGCEPVEFSDRFDQADAAVMFREGLLVRLPFSEAT